MVELRLAQGGSMLAQVVGAIKTFVTYADFDFSADGLYIHAVNKSRTAKVELLLKPEAFEHYHCDPEIFIHRVNLNTMSRRLKCARNDIVTIKASDDSVLNYVFENRDEDETRNFTTNIVDSFVLPNEEADEYDFCRDPFALPEEGYDAIVTMPSYKFDNVCYKLNSVYGEEVVVAVKETEIKFSIEDSFDISANVLCRVDKPEDTTVIEMNRPMSTNFHLKYLCNCTEATPLSDTVTLRLSANVASVIEYTIAEKGYIRFHLHKLLV